VDELRSRGYGLNRREVVVPRRSKLYKSNGPTARFERTGVCCSIDGCERAVFRKGLCTAHFKRVQRGQPIGGAIGAHIMTGEMLMFKKNEPPSLQQVMSLEERMIVTGSAWLECSAEDDELYAYRRHAFKKAVATWLESLGWKPPVNAARKLRK
jgi:hypothetical protein